MNNKQKTAIEKYQCAGCVSGSDIECYEKSDNMACGKHCAGTHIYPSVGRIFLGMPKGFNRMGSSDDLKIHIFESLNDGWGYDKFNVPVWKHLDDSGNVIVRGVCPRTNYTWIHIFLEDCLSEIECREITLKDIEGMD